MGRTNAVLLAILMTSVAPAAAQSAAERQTLAGQIEQRFEVLPVQGGVVLKPKTPRDIQSIELTGGAIAIDGEPVTGAELRRRLDGDADVILRLSYLDASAQRALFAQRRPQPPAAPGAAGPQPPEPPLPPVPPTPPRRRGRNSDRVRIGASVDVAAGEIVDGDVVAIGGSVNVDGEVHGEVVAIGGGVTLGPRADVEGDVTVVGGALRRDPAARIGGDVHDVALGDVNIWPGWRRFWPPFNGQRVAFFGSPLGSVFAVVSTLTRLAVLCILASIVLLFGRGYVERVSVRAASEPVKAGAVGLLIQLLFVPVFVTTIVVLVITIVGIPLLTLVPFAVLAFVLLFLVGFTAVACDLGRFAVTRFGGEGQNPYLIAATGIALVLSPMLLSRLIGLAGGTVRPITVALLLVGLFAEWMAWTVGLGAVALVRFERRIAS